MKIIKLSPTFIAAAVFAVSSCGESTSTSLIDDAAITEDIAGSAGDAIATSLESMLGNESAAGLAGGGAALRVAAVDNSLSFTRTRTCYDAADAVMNPCNPLSAVRKVVTHATADGSRSGSRTNAQGVTKTWSGVVHRVFDDTLTRNFDSSNPPVEASRTHSAVIAGNDTTMFSDGTASAELAESTSDTVKAVTWNLPRSSNPFPVSGSIVRVNSIHVTMTRDERTESREFTRIIRVDFPADAQGNVVLTVNDLTCNLNLVTHVVSNCQ